MIILDDGFIKIHSVLNDLFRSDGWFKDTFRIPLLVPAHFAICLTIRNVVFMSICPVSKLINAVVLLILLTALSDPEQYHLTSAELANDLDVMDDASKSPRNPELHSEH